MTPEATKNVYTVKQLNRALRSLLEMSYPSIWVSGEISGLATPASGHLYFSLKDENSIIRCAFFRNRQNRHNSSIRDGMQVLLRGQLSYYESRGDLQLIVSYLEQAGEGVLRRAFEMLKQKLAAQGLFEQQHKSEIPTYPTTIGIITSDSGAALHDILVTLKHRYPLTDVVIYPTLVQGAEAANNIIAAIDSAEKHNQADTLILARGGGSMEDLQAFNDERVARKIFACCIPLISGIGHEVDFTICDFVADARAATPTAAAQLATPEISQLRGVFRLLHHRLHENARQYIRNFQQSVDYSTSRLVHPKQKLFSYCAEHQHLYKQLNFYIHKYLTLMNSAHKKQADIVSAHCPSTRIHYLQQRLHTNRLALSRCGAVQISNKQHLLQQNHEKIKLMSPQHTLQRGYAIVQNHDNKVITAPDHTQPGQSLRIRLCKGQIRVLVDGT